MVRTCSVAVNFSRKTTFSDTSGLKEGLLLVAGLVENHEMHVGGRLCDPGVLDKGGITGIREKVYMSIHT